MQDAIRKVKISKVKEAVPMQQFSQGSKPDNTKNNGQAVKDQKQPQAKSIQISDKAMMVSTILVALVLVASIILTLVLKPGVIESAADGSLRLLEGENHMTWWKYLLSPVLVLSPMYENFATVWSILLLCIVIGAVFNAMDECGILIYMVETLARKFGKSKYKLLFVLSLVMMILGTTLGISEEVVPLVPLAVMLFYALGWDSPLAILACDLSACAGFTVGVINPFNTGLAQSLSGEISMYSGVMYRLALFAVFYGVLWFWLRRYAKKLDKDPESSCTFREDTERKNAFRFDIESIKKDPVKDRALKWFVGVIGVVLVLALTNIAVSTVLSKAAEKGGVNAELFDSISSTLSGTILYMIILGYTIAGIGASIRCGLKGKALLKKLSEGVLTLLPAAAMILLASAIGFIFAESGVSDTIVYFAAGTMGESSGFVCVLLLMIFLFILEIFIPSASGKAFLIMPLAFRLCTVLGIHHQLAVLAFLFADGFANSMLPSNSGLLITLGMTPVSYPKWIRVAGPVFLSFFILAVGALAFGYFVLY